ncbi:COG1470 family protein [Patulibacter defluvii]|uniref:COG1470 family protein n=1 Tax=Patulibacter defluvii TaxID=3095358 RepID=UPI002A7646AE|nr:NEW3 domain-containing protein [Patulibacter sp. DM4]
MSRSVARRRTAAALFSSAVVAVLAAPTTSPASFVAVGRDAAGDGAGGQPSRDITAAGVAYDRRSGTLRGGVVLSAAPGPAANVVLLAGTKATSGCDGYPAIGLYGLSDAAGGQWARFDAAGPATATGAVEHRGGGTLQTFDVTDPALAGRPLTCLTALVVDPADPNLVYDSAGPFALHPQPALDVRIARVATALRPGRSRTVRLTLRNPGDARTDPIRLRVSRQRGLTVRAPRSVPSLKAGKRRTVSLRVTLSRRAKTSTPLRVQATAGKLRVRAETTVSRRKPPRRPTGTGACATYAPVLGGVGDIVVSPC